MTGAALYGSGARHTVKGGTGSGEVNSRYFVTIEKGLENAGFKVTTKRWLDAYDEAYVVARKEFIKAIKVRARKRETFLRISSFRIMECHYTSKEFRTKVWGDGSEAVNDPLWKLPE